MKSFSQQSKPRPQDYRAKDIIIQEDNERPYSKGARKAIGEATKAEGWNMIVLQPHHPNSHDLNVLDLGFFNSIPNLQHQKLARTADELVPAVEAAFR